MNNAKHTQQAEVLRSLCRASHESMRRQPNGVSDAVQFATANGFPTALQEAANLQKLCPSFACLARAAGCNPRQSVGLLA